jgi:hypothetical protein
MPFFPQFSNLFVAPAVPISLLSGLLAYWKLDTISWIDSSGNGNTLLSVNDVSLVAGKIANCSEFDGSNNFQVGSFYSANNSFSIAGWFNASDLSQNDYSVFFGTVPLLNFQLYLSRAGEISYALYGSTPIGYNTGSSVNTNEWHHYVAVGNSSTSELKLYLDGSLIYTSNDSGSVNAVWQSGAAIGMEHDSVFNVYGKIDEVGIWNTNLTGSEVSYLYNAGAGRTYPFN